MQTCIQSVYSLSSESGDGMDSALRGVGLWSPCPSSHSYPGFPGPSDLGPATFLASSGTTHHLFPRLAFFLSFLKCSKLYPALQVLSPLPAVPTFAGFTFYSMVQFSESHAWTACPRQHNFYPGCSCFFPADITY